MKQRKTITLNETFLNISGALSPGDRLIYLESILKHFLRGESLPKDNISDALKIAFISTLPQIRVLQTKAENGLAEKKSPRSSKVSLCPKSEADLSELKRNDIIINPLNLLSFINKYIINKQSSACADTREREALKQEGGAPATSLQKLFTNDIEIYNQFEKIAKTIINQEKELKISGKTLSSVAAANFLKKLIQSEAGAQIILDSIRTTNTTPGINNKTNYCFAMMYNKFYKHPARQETPGFNERTYTKEELDSLFDDVD